MRALIGDVVLDTLVGRCGVPDTNDSGEKQIGLCIERELVVRSSLYKKRDNRKYT